MKEVSSRPGPSGPFAAHGGASIRPLLVVLLSTLLSLLLAEAFLRAFRPVAYRAVPERTQQRRAGGLGDQAHRHSEIPGLSYELAPDVRTVHKGIPIETNSHGMRDAEPAEAGPDLVRVAVLGDSFTFGLGVGGDETYPSVLERMLNESLAPRGLRADVLNFGVVGYNSREEAIVLREKALPFEPDVVVLGYVHNDPETDPYHPIHRFFFRPEPWERSHLLRLIASAKNEWDSRGLDGSMGYIRRINSHPAKWASVERSMRSVARDAAGRDVPVILLVFPMRPGRTWDAYPYADLHERIAAVGAANGMRVVDLLPAYSEYPPRRVLAGDGHPSVLGHELAARAVFDAMVASPGTYLRGQAAP